MPIEEKWKPVSGIPNYAISSVGRVIRTKKGKRGNAPKRMIMAQHVHQGFNRVSLYIGNNKYRNIRVDVLVLSNFRKERPSKIHFAEHLDEDNFNDTLSNLTWVKRER